MTEGTRFLRIPFDDIASLYFPDADRVIGVTDYNLQNHVRGRARAMLANAGFALNQPIDTAADGVKMAVCFSQSIDIPDRSRKLESKGDLT